jgi:hypothetical protein
LSRGPGATLWPPATGACFRQHDRRSDGRATLFGLPGTKVRPEVQGQVLLRAFPAERHHARHFCRLSTGLFTAVSFGPAPAPTTTATALFVHRRHMSFTPFAAKASTRGGVFRIVTVARASCLCPAFPAGRHGRDARGTHGRDAHATVCFKFSAGRSGQVDRRRN